MLCFLAVVCWWRIWCIFFKGYCNLCIVGSFLFFRIDFVDWGLAFGARLERSEYIEV